MTKITALLLMVAFVSAGCADVEMANEATNDFGRYTQLEKGVTSKTQVFALFGQPSDVIYNQDGTSKWSIVSVQTRAAGITYVPFIGILAGGQRQNIREAAFNFNIAGRYTSVETSQYSVYENNWTGLARAGSSIDSPAFGRVKNEMKKVGLRYDKNKVFPSELYNSATSKSPTESLSCRGLGNVNDTALDACN